MTELDALERRLGYVFSDKSLLLRALTHTSVIAKKRHDTYERLEFLGDRVLGLVVAEMLYDHFEHEEEGALAKRFTALVRAETLARVALDLDLGAHMVLAPSEEDGGGRENTSILSDVMEAVIAALYREGGFDVAAAFVRGRWTALMGEDLSPPRDAKTTLQEWAQGRGLALPAYVEINRSGPAHAPEFTVSVTVSGLDPVMATGSSKRTAEQAAAMALLADIENKGKDA